MSERVFEPESGDFASHDTSIVILNHGGSTVSQDTGRDAQYLANVSGLSVIAADRPGTAGFIPDRSLAQAISTPDGYVQEMTALGRRIDRQVESLGVRNVLVHGRSAGGLGALALARSETVSNFRYLVAAEPVGCENLAVEDGLNHYKAYGDLQKKLQAESNPGELVLPQSPGLGAVDSVSRMASMVPAFMYDRFHNQQLWATDAAIEYAQEIAARYPNIDTTLLFAQHSLVARQEVYDRAVVGIPNMRTSGAPFEVRQVESTTHASFDNRDFMASLLAPVIERAIA